MAYGRVHNSGATLRITSSYFAAVNRKGPYTFLKSTTPTGAAILSFFTGKVLKDVINLAQQMVLLK
jgi:hypothetical protein